MEEECRGKILPKLFSAWRVSLLCRLYSIFLRPSIVSSRAFIFSILAVISSEVSSLENFSIILSLYP